MSSGIFSAVYGSCVTAVGWAAHIAWCRRRLNLARKDPLTGLPTRYDWHSRARRIARDPFPAIVTLVDLDDFKAVNDSFGHAGGDAVLKEAAARLAAWCAPHGIAGRLGGDEFAAVIVAEDADYGSRLQALHDALHQPVPWRGTWLPMRASIGAARLADLQEPSISVALRHADAAMYEAKIHAGWQLARPGEGPPAIHLRPQRASRRGISSSGTLGPHHPDSGKHSTSQADSALQDG
ncbi:GGDEF domain-containing protein [Streptomyces sp. NPDC046915]|uniref:GGDEF domain-containing protein n=1 Tax=Streptomyces sp. NPDC046915 TaxID=3155257 RepID=UPI0033E6E5BB